jgi:hypothetical protein
MKRDKSELPFAQTIHVEKIPAFRASIEKRLRHVSVDGDRVLARLKHQYPAGAAICRLATL